MMNKTEPASTENGTCSECGRPNCADLNGVLIELSTQIDKMEYEVGKGSRCVIDRGEVLTKIAVLRRTSPPKPKTLDEAAIRAVIDEVKEWALNNQNEHGSVSIDLLIDECLDTLKGGDGNE